MSRRGRFVTLEGPDGSGKSTQAVRLADRLQATGQTVLLTREPGGTGAGESIRDLLQHTPSQQSLCPEAETLLFAASRAQLVHEVIRPALTEGAWVICDRFADSTTVYQGAGRGMPLAELEALRRLATRELEPDLTLLVDVPVQTGRARLAQRNGAVAPAYDRMEAESIAFHERVRDGYLELARRCPNRIRVVDGGRAPDAVADEVWRICRETLQA